MSRPKCYLRELETIPWLTRWSCRRESMRVLASKLGPRSSIGAQENGIHEVTGSIPVSSTNSSNKLRKRPQPLNPRRVSGGSVLRLR
jgi:hypothetical protein